ncbi:MAG: hypothetical protein JSS62_06035 [Verrucomicrobia bacterium]|nr:hypothetical protein [Verrucomicrobiota bacterium]MBS0645758.1 hypothetical protein [Verrucomicrobiota bacterium]
MTPGEKLGAAVGTLAGLAILAGCIFGTVHMATHYSMYHGDWGIDRITLLKVWKPDYMNSLGMGAVFGQLFGYIIGTAAVVGSIASFANNYKDAKQRPLTQATARPFAIQER